MTSPATADLYDYHGDNIRVLTPMFRDYGGNSMFSGSVVTLKVHEDNTLVRELLEQPGEGRVLVVDGGGSLRCALVGGNLGQLGVDNGWAGIVVYGCIRDTVEIEIQAIGVKALNTNPKKSVKKGVGEIDVPVTFGGTTIQPGEWLYADRDGVVISDKQL